MRFPGTGTTPMKGEGEHILSDISERWLTEAQSTRFYRPSIDACDNPVAGLIAVVAKLPVGRWCYIRCCMLKQCSTGKKAFGDCIGSRLLGRREAETLSGGT